MAKSNLEIAVSFIKRHGEIKQLDLNDLGVSVEELRTALKKEGLRCATVCYGPDGQDYDDEYTDIELVRE